MAEQFGKTWWGSEWLRSLTHIDYDNRIPRGATYARKGNVIDIKLKDNRQYHHCKSVRKQDNTI